MIANAITKDKRWPWALPDPHTLACEAHKEIQNRLLEIRFRDNTKLMDSVIIDYEASFSRGNFDNLAADEEAGAA